jgi:hypothetical protein
MTPFGSLLSEPFKVTVDPSLTIWSAPATVTGPIFAFAILVLLSNLIEGNEKGVAALLFVKPCSGTVWDCIPGITCACVVLTHSALAATKRKTAKASNNVNFPNFINNPAEGLIMTIKTWLIIRIKLRLKKHRPITSKFFQIIFWYNLFTYQGYYQLVNSRSPKSMLLT